MAKRFPGSVFYFFVVILVSRRLCAREGRMELHLANGYLQKWKSAQFSNILEMGIKFQHLTYYSGVKKKLVSKSYLFL